MTGKKQTHRHVLEACLKEAGSLIHKAIYQKKKISYKGRLSLVTTTDKQAEAVIIKRLSKNYPDHGLLAEESGARETKSAYRWIIDPLDGTTNFAHGFPMACVSIALTHEDKMILGGVYEPTRDELYVAERGRGATLNGKTISVSDTPELAQALLVTGLPYDRFKENRADYYLSYHKAFMMKCHGVRRTGSAALDLCYVACGRFDGFWEFHLKPWDTAAGALIVEEAGGRCSDFNGGNFNLNGQETLATNGKVHEEMVRILKICGKTSKEYTR